VEGDHHNPTARVQQINRLAEACFQCLQLIVYINAQRLKRARGRMNPFSTSTCCSSDYLGQLTCGSERSGIHDCPGNLPRSRFFSVADNQVSQLPLR
jgi:hypothetical protein